MCLGTTHKDWNPTVKSKSGSFNTVGSRFHGMHGRETPFHRFCVSFFVRLSRSCWMIREMIRRDVGGWRQQVRYVLSSLNDRHIVYQQSQLLYSLVDRKPMYMYRPNCRKAGLNMVCLSCVFVVFLSHAFICACSSCHVCEIKTYIGINRETNVFRVHRC